MKKLTKQIMWGVLIVLNTVSIHANAATRAYVANSSGASVAENLGNGA